jgi:hypothetical protein
MSDLDTRLCPELTQYSPWGTVQYLELMFKLIQNPTAHGVRSWRKAAIAADNSCFKTEGVGIWLLELIAAPEQHRLVIGTQVSTELVTFKPMTMLLTEAELLAVVEYVREIDYLPERMSEIQTELEELTNMTWSCLVEC